MGRGGYRWNAGRPGWRGKCEHRLALDIRVLARRGHLQSEGHIPRYFSWQWTRGDEPAGNIRIRADGDQLQLTYTWTPYGGQPQALDYTVKIVRTPCRYGGTRPWFECPRCWDRRAVLYGVANDGRFGCRRCMRLAYASETEDACGRSWRTQRKLAARLGAKDDTNPHPSRPKGMHRRTYEQILRRIWDQEMRREEQLYLFMRRQGLLRT
jgi:hypothetical protein